MGFAVCYIFIDLHLSITVAFPDGIVGIVEIVFDINLQFLIQGMGILDLMMHACSCPVVLHPGLLFQQGTVIQRICSVVAISDGYFHGRICHGDIFFELDAILSEVVIIVI